MGENNSEPFFLKRVSFPHSLKVDQEGYVLTHLNDPESGNRSLPMVHEQEWESIARLMALYEAILDGSAFFLLLTIDPQKVENLSNKPPGFLRFGEYFGHVHKSAVTSVEQMTWKVGDQSAFKDALLQASKKKNFSFQKLKRMFVQPYSLGDYEHWIKD